MLVQQPINSIQLYQEGDTPRDKRKHGLTQSAIVTTGGIGLVVAGLGFVGVPLISLTGIGAMGFAAIGVGLVAVDWVLQHEIWEQEDLNGGPDYQIVDSLPVQAIQATRVSLAATVPLNRPTVEPSINEAVTVLESPTKPLAPTVRNVPVETQVEIPTTVEVVEPIQNVKQSNFVPGKIRPLLDRITNVAGFVPSRLFTGASRSGKSQLASDSATTVRMEKPGATIYYMSAGFKLSEDGWYWAAADHIAGYDLKRLKPEEIKAAYEHWSAMFDDFRDNEKYSMECPKILIIDELNSIIAAAPMAGPVGETVKTKVKNHITFAGSTGGKDGYVVWGIAPIGDCLGLGVSRGQVSALNPVFVGVYGDDWNATVFKTASPNGLAPSQTPIGFRNGERVVGIGGNWESLPVSQNLAKTLVKVESKVTLEEPEVDVEELANKVIEMMRDMSNRGLDTSEIQGKLASLTEDNGVKILQSILMVGA
jgi:hypothetical protein